MPAVPGRILELGQACQERFRGPVLPVPGGAFRGGGGVPTRLNPRRPERPMGLMVFLGLGFFFLGKNFQRR